MPEEGMTIVFYYRAKQETTPTYLLTVVCKDEASGQQFDSFSVGRHAAGATVTIPHKDYSGREFVSGPSTHMMPAKDDTVILVYRQKSGGDPTYAATRRCVDEAGNELRSDGLGSHKAGTVLTASQIGKPDIPGYTYKSGLSSLTISATGSNVITLVYSKNPGDGNGDKTPTAGTSQNGEGDKGGGDNAANNGGDGSYQDYDKEKAEADRIAAEAAAAEKRRQEEEAERQRQEAERKKQEEEARQKELENAQNQGQGDGLTTENGEAPDLPDEEIPAPSTDWEETKENPDGSTTTTTTNASTGEQTTQTTQTDGSGNSTTESSSSQQDPNRDTKGEIEEPPAD